MNSTEPLEAPVMQESKPLNAAAQLNSANIQGLPDGTKQQPLGLVTPIKPASIEILRGRLLQIRRDIDNGVVQPFETLGTVHYLRLIIMDPQEGDTTTPTKLVFGTDYDGDEEEHLTALCTSCGPFLDHLYECCENYPASPTPESRKAYLSPYKVKPSAFFAGAPGRTLKQVKQESILRNFIWNIVQKGNWKNKTATDIHKEIKEAVFANKDFEWAKTKAKLPSIRILGMALLGIILIALLPVIIIWIVVLHFAKERSDKSLDLTPAQIDRKHIAKLEDYEDFHNQNQFTQLLIMKPGKMRLITLQGLMLFAKALVNNLFVDGKLMGIPTIHFARWQMLENNKRMIFFSNFDGSWTQYLGDFIDKSGWGLTGIWSNTINFPKTNFLLTGGAYDAEHFLAWSRYYQIPTAVWYCAYPNLSIKNVMNNTHLRNGLTSDFSEKDAQKFLDRI